MKKAIFPWAQRWCLPLPIQHWTCTVLTLSDTLGITLASRPGGQTRRRDSPTGKSWKAASRKTFVFVNFPQTGLIKYLCGLRDRWDLGAQLYLIHLQIPLSFSILREHELAYRLLRFVVKWLKAFLGQSRRAGLWRSAQVFVWEASPLLEGKLEKMCTRMLYPWGFLAAHTLVLGQRCCSSSGGCSTAGGTLGRTCRRNLPRAALGRWAGREGRSRAVSHTEAGTGWGCREALLRIPGAGKGHGQGKRKTHFLLVLVWAKQVCARPGGCAAPIFPSILTAGLSQPKWFCAMEMTVIPELQCHC